MQAIRPTTMHDRTASRLVVFFINKFHVFNMLALLQLPRHLQVFQTTSH
jgi:hypothetical protein